METQTPVYTCSRCGRKFVVSSYDKENALRFRTEAESKLCYTCIKYEHFKNKQEKEEQDRIARQKEAEIAKLKFEKLLENYTVVNVNNINLSADNTLFVIGNGFDLMHKIKSTYYHFRDSMGKSNDLREALENYLDVKDVWYDFEYALGKFNMQLIAGNVSVDTSLDFAGAYEDDFGMAEFTSAAEMAAAPISTIAYELPIKFRKWIESLKVYTKDRPLKRLLKDGKTLCFNYTEFPETLYNITEDNICYIHGCRKNKDDTFILGHIVDENDTIFEFEDKYMPTKSKYKQQLIAAAQEQVLHIAAECDKGLTKNCAQIISSNADFFSSLNNIKNIVLIGHSMSAVDMPYFKEILKNVNNADDLLWYVSCYGLDDLEHLQFFKSTLSIPDEQIKIFRTDNIEVPLPADITYIQNDKPKKTNLIKTYTSKHWKIETIDGLIKIFDKDKKVFEIEFSSPLRKCVFSPNENILFAVTQGLGTGVFLLSYYNNEWHFINELSTIPNQYLLNKRLNNIFLDNTTVTFVYNNRMRCYSLANGELMENDARRYKYNYHYSGVDIKSLF